MKTFKISINFEENIFESESLKDIWNQGLTIKDRKNIWITEYEGDALIDYCTLNWFMLRFVTESFVPKTISKL